MNPPTRQQRRTWRRRLSRAHHTKNTHRAVMRAPHGIDLAIGVWGRDLDDMYPDRIIRSPMAPRWP